MYKIDQILIDFFLPQIIAVDGIKCENAETVKNKFSENFKAFGKQEK